MTCFVTPDYGVKVKIAAPIIVAGQCYGDFEGWALSEPNSPELKSVCIMGWDPVARIATVGMELPKPGPFAFDRKANAIEIAAAAELWRVALTGATQYELRSEFYRSLEDRRIEAEADAYRAGTAG